VSPGYVVCVDTGSTFTKAAAVDVGSDAGRLLATASVPTTVGPGLDVLTGLDAAVAAVVAEAGGQPADVRACSSAGGGLRLAVVGHERVVTAEAGARVGLSAGAKVVHVASGRLDRAALDGLKADRPDVVLLVGGTDGGDADVVLHNAARLAASGPRVPYVVACNADARDEAGALLAAKGRTVVACANVLPRIGVLDPLPARAAIREVFVSHVIGGKGLSKGRRFATMVSGATPDVVLRAVELLADGTGGLPGVGDVLVVDVGGATTDVYSVVSPDPAAEHAETEDVIGTWRAGRTVEGDLGMRWSAPGVVAAAEAERLATPAGVREAAQALHDDVSAVPVDDRGRATDEWLATTAVTVAARRHSRPAELPGGTLTAPRDLRRVALVVGSGGVLRHADGATRARVLAPLREDLAGGWLLPDPGTPVVVDALSVLGAAGLLAPDLPEVAMRLMRDRLLDVRGPRGSA